MDKMRHFIFLGLPPKNSTIGGSTYIFLWFILSLFIGGEINLLFFLIGLVGENPTITNEKTKHKQ